VAQRVEATLMGWLAGLQWDAAARSVADLEPQWRRA
jgi:hypothetical protein